MQIKTVEQNKKDFLDLLLLGDEQEDMIDKYLERSELFTLYEDGLKGACTVTCESKGEYEIKNIAVYPQFQRCGYGGKLIEYAFSYYAGSIEVMYVGTGDCPSALGFYKAHGFTESHRIKDFFTNNYAKPIFEGGIQLIDMVYLKRENFG